MQIKDSFLVFLAYVFGIPALYIVLSDCRKKEYVGFHGGHALIVWCAFFAVFFLQRFLVDMIWSVNYIPELEWIEAISLVVMGGYALFCGCRGLTGRIFKF